MATKKDPRSFGMRITEAFLPFFGPAQLGRQDADGRGVSDAERGRERELRTRFERVTGPDGRTYVVEHTD
ncbi:hypothetical protein [Cellulosimicrobium sp. CUA-896]|uniref:hypothetical protein n=1 Tax=Cellulosimicrobium sp. CUA-896 TaxID=1517881 RepID=UPI00095FB380|nr:hypothetical protein [Cellulosimicrobium sp. CUA-896]OLT48909.1 hypothetical protein BJF88_16485 [Cellulosimicrobium sp. CUA-896]